MKNLRNKVSSGRRVELDNGKIYIFFIGSGAESENGGWYGVLCNGNDPNLQFSDFDEDLCSPKHKIMALHDRPRGLNINKLLDPSYVGDCYWRREKETIELTMEEAIKKMGFDFKIKK